MFLVGPVTTLLVSSHTITPECRKSFVESSVYADIRQVSNNFIELSNIELENSEIKLDNIESKESEIKLDNTEIENSKFNIDNCNIYFDDATDNNQKLANFIESEAMRDEANLDSKSIKSLIALVCNSKEKFSKAPDVFFRDGEHPSLYWGLGSCRHLTLSVIDDNLLLSVVFPNYNIRKILEAKADSFLQIQQEINSYV